MDYNSISNANLFRDILDFENDYEADKSTVNVKKLIEGYKQAVEFYEHKGNHLLQKEFLNKIQEILVSKDYINSQSSRKRGFTQNSANILTIIDNSKNLNEMINLNVNMNKGIDVINNNLEMQGEQLRIKLNNRKSKNNGELKHVKFMRTKKNEKNKEDEINSFFTEYVNSFFDKFNSETAEIKETIKNNVVDSINKRLEKMTETYETEFEFEMLLETSEGEHKLSLQKMINTMEDDLREYYNECDESLKSSLKSSFERNPYNLDHIVIKAFNN